MKEYIIITETDQYTVRTEALEDLQFRAKEDLSREPSRVIQTPRGVIMNIDVEDIVSIKGGHDV